MDILYDGRSIVCWVSVLDRILAHRDAGLHLCRKERNVNVGRGFEQLSVCFGLISNEDGQRYASSWPQAARKRWTV